MGEEGAPRVDSAELQCKNAISGAAVGQPGMVTCGFIEFQLIETQHGITSVCNRCRSSEQLPLRRVAETADVWDRLSVESGARQPPPPPVAPPGAHPGLMICGAVRTGAYSPATPAAAFQPTIFGCPCYRFRLYEVGNELYSICVECRKKDRLGILTSEA